MERAQKELNTLKGYVIRKDTCPFIFRKGGYMEFKNADFVLLDRLTYKLLCLSKEQYANLRLKCFLEHHPFHIRYKILETGKERK